ncbi:MAG TPA: sigma-70 family RNA polymerase sigma factor [Candidatus Eisenbacteria bacterium]|nr:sigma-70 family RNA polymerase sigma factor [Candidatus Eisenbacteria bacterium]
MNANEMMGEQFEANRSHLRAVAYRMLGSLSEADDAVQEAWLRLSRSESSDIQNLGGWLTTVVARVCLDMLRSRKAKAEQSLEEEQSESVAKRGTRVFGESVAASDPEQEAILAESVGLALLVVLDTLAPAERLAFVLHDIFAVPFEEIAPIVGRSEDATRQLANRARRRVQGVERVRDGRLASSELAGQREVVDAFLAAMHARDFEGLIAVLDPDVLVRVESPEGVREVRGARNWAKGALEFQARLRDPRFTRFMQPALVDGAVGIILAPGGRLSRVLRFTIADGKIREVEIIVNPERLRNVDLAVLD